MNDLCAQPARDAALVEKDIEVMEQIVTRIAVFVLMASTVADRNEFLPCLDYWGTRERMARLDDAVLAGRRALQRLSSS